MVKIARLFLLFLNGIVVIIGVEATTPTWNTPSWLDSEQYPQVSSLMTAQSYLLLDITYNQIITMNNIDSKIILASLTKLMTVLLVMDAMKAGKFSPNDSYTVLSNDILDALPSDASRMGLRKGDMVTGAELLKGLLVLSGNDAAIFLAIILEGSVANFVKKMNQRSVSLGLTHTKFADASGLSPFNVSTAREIALLARYVLAYKSFDITQITAVPYFYWLSNRKSTNMLLGHYQGVNGLKTGFIEEAGFNFIATAERKGRRLLAVIIGVHVPTIAQGVQVRAEEARTLLDYGFLQFTPVHLGYKPFSVKVWGASRPQMNVTVRFTTLVLPHEWMNCLQSRRLYSDTYIFAPIKISQKIGVVQYMVLVGDDADPIIVVSLPIISAQTIKKGNIFLRLYHRVYVFLRKRKSG